MGTWFGSPPQLLEPCRVGGRVLDGVLDVPVSEVILNEPSIRALIGQGEAASVAQHVGMGEQGQGSGGAVFSQEQVNGRAAGSAMPLCLQRGALSITSIRKIERFSIC